MDDTIQLLSTMSPKVKEGYKASKKGTSVLALKKHFRRSAAFDKQTIKTENVVECSSNSSSLSESPKVQRNVAYDVIEISDSECSESSADEQPPPKPTPSLVQTVKRNLEKELEGVVSVPLSKQKMQDIQSWIGKLPSESQSERMNLTQFSEVSTIFGDEVGGNFQIEGAAIAVNSTQLTTDVCRFDELFKKPSSLKKTDETEYNFKTGTQEQKDNDFIEINNSLGNLCIEDSFEERVQKRLSNENSKGSNLKCAEIEQSTEEVESLLDNLYGTSWRENRETVLPKSEPKKRNVLKPVVANVPKTEQKPTRPFNLLKNLQKNTLSKKFESPWADRLKYLCDTDTESDDSDNKLVRTKLNFDNLDADDKTSKYFKKFTEDINKENDPDMSDLGASLEDRITKKLNNIEIKKPVKTKGVNKKPDSTKHPTTNKKTISKKTAKVDDSTSSSGEDVPFKKVGKARIRSSDSSDDWFTDTSDEKTEKAVKKETYTFLESLSASVPLEKCDMAVRLYRKNFKQNKEKLAAALFTLYNEEIFEKKIPADISIDWNDRMRGSAGFCFCKKITRKSGKIERSVRIQLATKVVDSPDRLRDTLVHELCHAATWMVNNVSDGHGHYWKAWASKAMKRFPELPPIKRCHDYQIKTKYTYKCTKCGYSFGRHSKSLNTDQKRCGYCHGQFEVLINKTSKSGETKTVPVTPRKEPTAFSLFVKENYAKVKTPLMKHAEVMKILGQKFGEQKQNN
ncbi:germ cell nuclear acidic protein-like isoform X2 [Aethina tumida]|uniref:germ cell nuclear acidic protein-like isoform X2 n=1 Tax=Aethina tumida TaxID=116153 RepID=UPI0021485B13|nr:germ cell nuclear acidic protein-like isoform X2 [Aethina tumida]